MIFRATEVRPPGTFRGAVNSSPLMGAPGQNVEEERGGPAEGEATDVLRIKRISQTRPAVWCKGRIQVLVEVAVKRNGALLAEPDLRGT